MTLKYLKDMMSKKLIKKKNFEDISEIVRHLKRHFVATNLFKKLDSSTLKSVLIYLVWNYWVVNNKFEQVVLLIKL